MSRNCCTNLQRINKNQLPLQILSLNYGSADMIKDLLLPRKYTTTHNDVPPKLFVAVGHEYDKCLLSSPEVIQESTQVVGQWVKKDDKYEIHLEALVSDAAHPNAKARNTEFCNFMSIVLETIGFAEVNLLRRHPELARTRIYIHFKSNDPTYDRVEYWHRLGYWLPKRHEIKKPEIKKPEVKRHEIKKRRSSSSSSDSCAECRRR